MTVTQTLKRIQGQSQLESRKPAWNGLRQIPTREKERKKREIEREGDREEREGEGEKKRGEGERRETLA